MFIWRRTNQCPVRSVANSLPVRNECASTCVWPMARRPVPAKSVAVASAIDANCWTTWGLILVSSGEGVHMRWWWWNFPLIHSLTYSLLFFCFLGDKPFTCEICGRSFSQKNHLKRHHMIHTGERPFPCEVCGRSFYRKDKLSTCLVHCCHFYCCNISHA